MLALKNKLCIQIYEPFYSAGAKTVTLATSEGGYLLLSAPRLTNVLGLRGMTSLILGLRT